MAQQHLASSYGFTDWPELRRVVEAGATVLEWFGRLLGRRALEALRDSGRTPPPRAFVAALRHPSPRVRFECLGLLHHLADEHSVPPMVAATGDPVPRVRRMAVHALGCQACKSSSLCADLNEVFLPIALNDPVWRVRRQAVLSIDHLPASDRGRGVLDGIAVHDSHPIVRRQAQWALGIQRGRGHSYGIRAPSESV